MKYLNLLMVLPMLAISAVAGAAEMEVRTWSGTCERSMTTNHFELAPGEEIELDLDLSGCSNADLGKILYFGYKTTKNSSKHLTTRDRVELTMRDAGQREVLSSIGGSILTDVANPTTCYLTARNTGRKPVTIRLRSSVITDN